MRFTIKAKLGVAFALVLLMLGGIGTLAITSLSSSNDRMQAFAARPFSQIQRVLRFESMSFDAARMFARSLLEPTNASREKLFADFKAHDAKFQGLLKDYTDLVPVEERARIQPLRDNWTKLSEAVTKGMEFAVLNGNNTAANLSTTELPATFADVTTRLSDLKNRADLSVEGRSLLEGLEVKGYQMRGDLYRAVVITDEAALAKTATAFGDLRSALYRDLVKLAELGATGGFSDGVGSLTTAVRQWTAVADKIFALGVANTDAKALRTYVGPFTDARKAVVEEVAKLRSYEEQVAQTFVHDTQGAYESTRTITITVAVSAVLLGIAMASWIAITISRGLSKAVASAQSVAAGDLTKDVAVTGRDEISDLLSAIQAMTVKLRGVVTEALMAASNVSSGSQELSASAEQLS
ncbi:HAMP domain-containing methyl-accepting chemotaxis protein, partial [Methylobacterium gossipiicola]